MSCNYNNKRGKTYKPHNKNNNSNFKFNKIKKSIEDSIFYIGNNKQATDFDTNFEFIVNYIKKTYVYGNDIAETLRTQVKKEDNDISWNL